MGSLRERLDDEVEKLRQARDELRVQVELGKMDAEETWNALEKRWERLEGKLKVIAEETGDVAGDVAEDARDAASMLVDEIRDGFKKISSLI
jgi:SMC interacting uncharacterized protein involved in chromosome segregation